MFSSPQVGKPIGVLLYKDLGVQYRKRLRKILEKHLKNPLVYENLSLEEYRDILQTHYYKEIILHFRKDFIPLLLFQHTFPQKDKDLFDFDELTCFCVTFDNPSIDWWLYHKENHAPTKSFCCLNVCCSVFESTFKKSEI